MPYHTYLPDSPQRRCAMPITAGCQLGGAIRARVDGHWRWLTGGRQAALMGFWMDAQARNGPTAVQSDGPGRSNSRWTAAYRGSGGLIKTTSQSVSAWPPTSRIQHHHHAGNIGKAQSDTWHDAVQISQQEYPLPHQSNDKPPALPCPGPHQAIQNQTLCSQFLGTGSTSASHRSSISFLPVTTSISCSFLQMGVRYTSLCPRYSRKKAGMVM